MFVLDVAKGIYQSTIICVNEFLHKFKIKNISVYHREIDKCLAITATNDYGLQFGGWALSKKSIRSFCAYLFCETSSPNIIELGGGLSTLFWVNMQKTCNPAIRVKTFEHNPLWGSKLNSFVTDKTIQINVVKIKQISDAEKNILFNNPIEASKVWLNMGKTIPADQNEDTRIKNTFYSLEISDIDTLESIDGLIVDGPHGNGRSIAFVLYYHFIHPGTIILIDDFNHYDFLTDLGRCFEYEILERQKKRYKSYIILRIIDVADVQNRVS